MVWYPAILATVLVLNYPTPTQDIRIFIHPDLILFILANDNVMLCYVMSRVKSCHVMSRHVVLCSVLLCHVMSCQVMSCHVMLCYVIDSRLTT